MHKADFHDIGSGEILKIARDKKDNGCQLVVIAGYVDGDGQPVIAYSFDSNGQIETYKCSGEKAIPSITGIYGVAAEWFEEEITEIMDVNFEGLKKTGRLFLPDEFDGSGQILVTPLSELKKE